MQTSEIMPTKKLVLVQGLDVVALAVKVLLIYLSLTARHIHRESESSVGFCPKHWHPTFTWQHCKINPTHYSSTSEEDSLKGYTCSRLINLKKSMLDSKLNSPPFPKWWPQINLSCIDIILCRATNCSSGNPIQIIPGVKSGFQIIYVHMQ